MVPSLPLLSCESSVSVKENPDRKKKYVNYFNFIIILHWDLSNFSTAKIISRSSHKWSNHINDPITKMISSNVLVFRPANCVNLSQKHFCSRKSLPLKETRNSYFCVTTQNHRLCVSHQKNKKHCPQKK